MMAELLPIDGMSKWILRSKTRKQFFIRFVLCVTGLILVVWLVFQILLHGLT